MGITIGQAIVFAIMLFGIGWLSGDIFATQINRKRNRHIREKCVNELVASQQVFTASMNKEKKELLKENAFLSRQIKYYQDYRGYDEASY